MDATAIAAPLGTAAATGSRQAEYDMQFSHAFQAHYTRLFAFVYSRVQDVDLARDMVSEVFERAYLKGHTVRDPNAYLAWLFMIGRNVIAGHFRRQKRALAGQNRLQESVRFQDQADDPEEHALKSERVGQLIRQIRTLPQRDQELLSLKFDAELTHVQIARITGLSPVNVRVAIFRALKRLKARMEKEEAQAASRITEASAA